ncbi:MAG: molecular chaperone DnaK [Mesoaciditoga sp.]|uniref:molecular chaperone DnaK n=1 Tax=Athalassotoga sp. TaxID=2022597 RepID=UPI000CB68556|nr:MAG: molecular chaperone DnaK [Mesoaciditoga sp.]PMP80477.1 MAG: molecular chaperone DnaK [Mesoaciditoga sp.]HEU23613.1 molecular chaperone DnaK [Mesoaciditoga lauensis]
MAEREYVVGIDLGTTNSEIAVVRNGKPEVIPNAEGSRLTPSVVAFTKTGEILVGEPAKRQAILNAERTIRSIKRQMGTNTRIKIDNKEYTPQEISAFILRKLKNDAEAFLGGKITKAVITVPAYFEDAQRQATKDAGRIAGLEVMRIINEPTAAALGYGIDKSKDEMVIVCDLGGGTFDVSLLEIGGGVIEVKATSGNNHLGGDDFDQRIIDWLIDNFKKETGVDLSGDKQAMQRLKDAAERAKIELTTKMETEINLPYITADANGPKHLQTSLTRAKLESLIRDIVEKMREPIETVLSDAKIAVEDIGEILLVGGPTRMPIVQEFLKNIFHKEPSKAVNPDEAVAIGAAIEASILAGETKREVVLVDVTPLSLGVEVKGGLMHKIIPRNTTIPTKKSEVFTTAEDGQTEVEINVLQGERELASDNKSLGRFTLTGIPPAPRGIPQIEVTFDIDSEGIVHVSAKDKATGKEQSIVIRGSSNLSEEEIKKMVEEAKKYQEEDAKRKQQVEMKNQADSLVYQMEKLLNEQGTKIDPSLRTETESLIKDLKDAIEKNDYARIKVLMDDLQKKSQTIGQKLYQSAASGNGSNNSSSTNDDTVNAEYQGK